MEKDAPLRNNHVRLDTDYYYNFPIQLNDEKDYPYEFLWGVISRLIRLLSEDEKTECCKKYEWMRSLVLHTQNSGNMNADKDMNSEQIELVKSYEKKKSSSLYKGAEAFKEVYIIQMGRSPEDIKNLIFDQLCMTAGWYGARGPEEFPLSKDVFIYLRGKIEERSSDYFNQFSTLFTKYDNYDLREMLDKTGKALVDWYCSSIVDVGGITKVDVAAITMYVAIQILTRTGSEDDKDNWLMFLMSGTDTDISGEDTENIENCKMLWEFTAIYLDFENRLDRIVKKLIAGVTNS